MNCGNCLMENVELVRLNADGTCPVCGIIPYIRARGSATTDELMPRGCDQDAVGKALARLLESGAVRNRRDPEGLRWFLKGGK
jgi:hypothetical protein